MSPRRKRQAPKALLLTHGAGSDRDHATLVAIDEGLDLPVARIDFPYRRQPGRRPPDRAPKLIECVVEEATAFADNLGIELDELALGGRSMGGRMCSMAVAEGMPAAALVLLSYPLHPPGRPEKLRVEHLPDIRVPTLFLGGDRDPFGTPDEFAEWVPTLGTGKRWVSQKWIEGGRHDIKNADEQIVELVRSWLARLQR